MPRGISKRMVFKRRFFLVLTSLLATLSLTALFPSVALADNGPIGSNTAGWDISWPQCGGPPLPDQRGDMFHVVGVTDGTPYTSNACFGYQFNYAGIVGPLSLYVNLDYNLAIGGGPLTCRPDDQGCEAYNYGWGAGVSAWDTARRDTNGASQHVDLWWLDVETANVWSDDTDLNTYVIQGALDFLQHVEGRTVGIYSTRYQWHQIAGDFAPLNTPNWVAGAASIEDTAQCQSPLWNGGTVWAFQYLNLDLNLDQNRGC